MSEQFTKGDVVVLKSGGPKMTIKFIEKGEAACSWFEGAKVSEASFDLEMLEAPKAMTLPLSRS